LQCGRHRGPGKSLSVRSRVILSVGGRPSAPHLPSYSPL
jgi:hypothetical protein